MIPASKLSPWFTESSTLESLYHRTVEEGFKHAILLQRQDKCTFQEEWAGWKLLHRETRYICEKYILNKWNEHRHCSRSFYKLHRDEKSPLTAAGHHVWHILSSPDTAVTTETHLEELITWRVHTLMKIQSAGWLHNLWTYTKCSCSAVSCTRY